MSFISNNFILQGSLNKQTSRCFFDTSFAKKRNKYKFFNKFVSFRELLNEKNSPENHKVSLHS